MKLFTIYIRNAIIRQYGRTARQACHPFVLFIFIPDGNGMRYEKVVSGVKTQYYYNDTQLLMESKNGKRKWYIYGVTGIEGMIVEGEYQNSVYYFDKNTLGDVIAIREEDGDVVARYTYDAWGKVTHKQGTMADANPFRYRGYYYDTETGFYYLQTRYYDSTICRFINADNYELVSELASVPGQLNMYTYCGNNPIMYTDETGEFFLTALLVGVIAGALIGATVAGVSAGNSGETGWSLVGSIAEGALIGAVLGGAAGALIGVAPTVGAFIGSTFASSAGAGSAVAVAMSSAYVVAVGATSAIGVNLMFSKGSGARFGHNQYENEQFRKAMKELGYKRTDPQWEKAHHALRKHKKAGNYIDKYRDLLKFIQNVLGV